MILVVLRNSSSYTPGHKTLSNYPIAGFHTGIFRGDMSQSYDITLILLRGSRGVLPQKFLIFKASQTAF